MVVKIKSIEFISGKSSKQGLVQIVVLYQSKSHVSPNIVQLQLWLMI